MSRVIVFIKQLDMVAVSQPLYIGHGDEDKVTLQGGSTLPEARP